MKGLNDYQKGVRELRMMLNSYLAEKNRRLLDDDVSYDRYTAQVVSQFQKDKNLPVTGEVDYSTWCEIQRNHLYYLKRLNCVYPPSNNPQLSVYYVIQAKINNLSNRYINIESVPISGNLDEATRQLLKQFQCICHLPQTGEVDCVTWEIIMAM